MRYEWANGRSQKVDAQIVGEIVEAIAEKLGVCSPRYLVEEARSKKSPLHPLFEWRDDVAAEHWRTEQARSTVQALRVTQIEGPSIPAFVHYKIVDEEGVAEGYTPTLKIQTDTDVRDFVLAEALVQLRSLKRRYENISALAPVWRAVADIEKQAV